MNKNTTKYQICYLINSGETRKVKGKETLIFKVNRTEIINATDRDQALTLAAPLECEQIRVYPFVTLNDGQTIMDAADKAVWRFWRWIQANDYAVESIDSVYNQWEDYKSIAAFAIVEQLNSDADTDMHTLRTIAFKAIRNAQASQNRRSEVEYMPGWIRDVLVVHQNKATYPEIDRLIAEVVDITEFTPAQMEVWELIHNNGLSIAHAAEHIGISKRGAAERWYKACCNFLETLAERVMLSDSNALDTLSALGIDILDIVDALATFKKRAKRK